MRSFTQVCMSASPPGGSGTGQEASLLPSQPVAQARYAECRPRSPQTAMSARGSVGPRRLGRQLVLRRKGGGQRRSVRGRLLAWRCSGLETELPTPVRLGETVDRDGSTAAAVALLVQ